MTFRDPAMLAGLLLLPLAALAYLSFQRRRRAEAATFAGLAGVGGLDPTATGAPPPKRVPGVAVGGIRAGGAPAGWGSRAPSGRPRPAGPRRGSRPGSRPGPPKPFRATGQPMVCRRRASRLTR